MSGALTIAYLVAGVLFIRSLGGLSKQETARQGNLFGFVGMLIAVPAAAAVGVLARFAIGRYLSSPFYTGGPRSGPG